MIVAEIKGVRLELETNEDVFSPAAVDRGTLAMLSLVDFRNDDRILDLGCGYGVVGVLAGKLIGGERVVMCDISEAAVYLSKINAEKNQIGELSIVLSNGLDQVEQRDFTLILSNPPYHADFSVPKAFIEKGYQRLKTGGKMLMVTKRREWYKNKFISVFGGVRIVEEDGYFVFIAEKREIKPEDRKKKPAGNEKHLSRKLNRKKRNGS